MSLSQKMTSRITAASTAILVFALIGLLGELFLHYRSEEEKNRQHIEALSYASMLRARAERELNSLLYLSSGLGSYLVVRKDDIKPKEINEILAVLYSTSSHIRNFGVAIGYKLSYVYPLAGNESAIGLYYPDQTAQWPVIEKIALSGKPALAGPVKLVQGGIGLIYRVPLSISGKYWGMLSTVIDADSFFNTLSDGLSDQRFDYAVRGKDGLGNSGDKVWGSLALFSNDDTVTQEIEVPGGRWVIGVKAHYEEHTSLNVLIRSLIAGFAAFIAWMLYMLIRSRTELGTLAMYDRLTGLPNRHLLEDRAKIAFARRRKKSGHLCALLFLDMDGFKSINDRYGHKADDAVLCATATRTQAILRPDDTVARWGGDEFIILLSDITQQTLDTLIARLRSELASSTEFNSHDLKVGVSIGVALYPENGISFEEMLKMADALMYSDKSQKKSPL